jgi:hypothetical protein
MPSGWRETMLRSGTNDKTQVKETPIPPPNFFASQRHRMTEMNRRKILKIAVFADSGTRTNG